MVIIRTIEIFCQETGYTQKKAEEYLAEAIGIRARQTEVIIDRATYDCPFIHARGLDYVIVGGKIAAENAVATGEKGGTMLFRDV